MLLKVYVILHKYTYSLVPDELVLEIYFGLNFDLDCAFAFDHDQPKAHLKASFSQDITSSLKAQIIMNVL